MVWPFAPSGRWSANDTRGNADFFSDIRHEQTDLAAFIAQLGDVDMGGADLVDLEPLQIFAIGLL